MDIRGSERSAESYIKAERVFSLATPDIPPQPLWPSSPGAKGEEESGREGVCSLSLSLCLSDVVGGPGGGASRRRCTTLVSSRDKKCDMDQFASRKIPP